MDYKKYKTDTIAVTRKVRDFEQDTDNIYEAVAILAKRANQIGLDLKKELDEKIAEFTTATDNLEEVFENPEQIEISKFFERLPKPSLISLQELSEDQIYFRINEAPEIEEK